MSAPVRITDGGGSARLARVTGLGQLVVAPLAYDETSFKELAEDDTAYNFYTPKPGQQFVITGIRLKADRDVSNTVDAVVVIYEAAAADTTTVAKVLFQENLVRGESATLIPLNILVSEGVWVNGKTSDDDVFGTVMGYFVDVV